MRSRSPAAAASAAHYFSALYQFYGLPPPRRNLLKIDAVAATTNAMSRAIVITKRASLSIGELTTREFIRSGGTAITQGKQRTPPKPPERVGTSNVLSLHH
jgi:hypothetical protein